MTHHHPAFNSPARFIPLMFIFVLGIACQNERRDGPKAPDFSLENLSGQTVTLKQHLGNLVVLDFWATWCPPCRTAIPELVKLQSKYEDQGLVVMGISMDDPRKVDNAYLQAFCEKFNTNYKILRYDYHVLESYFGSTTPSIPTLYVIDQKGQVRNKFIGMNAVALENSIKRLIQ